MGQNFFWGPTDIIFLTRTIYSADVLNKYDFKLHQTELCTYFNVITKVGSTGKNIEKNRKSIL